MFHKFEWSNSCSFRNGLIKAWITLKRFIIDFIVWQKHCSVCPYQLVIVSPLCSLSTRERWQGFFPTLKCQMWSDCTKGIYINDMIFFFTINLSVSSEGREPWSSGDHLSLAPQPYHQHGRWPHCLGQRLCAPSSRPAWVPPTSPYVIYFTKPTVAI